MQSRRLTAVAGLAGLALAACGGDDGSSLVDGAVFPDGGGNDAGGDCYLEKDDRDNGVEVEASGLALTSWRIAICGAIDSGHPIADVVDVDRFRFGVASSGPVVVRLLAPLGGQLGRIDLTLRDEDTGNVVSVARFRGGHAVTAIPLPAGQYVLIVEARGTAVPSGVPYRIEIAGDNPALRCPALGGVPSHTELDELMGGHRLNDVVDVRFAPDLTANLTSIGTDNPDVTGDAVSAGARISIAGLSAAVATTGDDYRDRDTFVFYTGASTNQLDLRTVWTGGSGNDLDLLLFENGNVVDPMATPSIGMGGDEISVTAVKPSAMYWLWVGGSRRSTTLPASYVVHVCGREIAPSSTNAK